MAEAKNGCYASFKLGRDYSAAILDDDIHDRKPALLKDMKDKAAALKSREDSMNNMFDFYDEMMGPGEVSMDKVDKF